VCLAVVVVATAAPNATAATLRSVLVENGVPATGAPAWLDATISGYAAFSDETLFAIACYRGAGTALPDTFDVVAFDRRSGRWRAATLPRRRGNVEAGGWDAGTFVEIRRGTRHLYLEAHLNPSASTTLVLNDALAVEGTADGRIRAVLPGDAFLFEKSTIHFAPTHTAELWIYTSADRRSSIVYPLKPHGGIRAAYIERVRGIYAALGEQWMREHNHHGDAERFNSAILQPVVVNSGGTVTAFVVRFGTTDVSPGSTPAQDVMVICRALTAAPQCVESLVPKTSPSEPDSAREAKLRRALEEPGAPPRRD
jgi:hypothetical protein